MIMKNIITLFAKLSGIELTPVSHAERIASAVGGFMAILCVFVISRWFVGPGDAGILVASMGASAVLLFAVPHGQLSQPWPVLGGHVISAIIGVSCALTIANEIVAASVAVGLAVGAMYYLRCIHPPGGATALSAVVGGEATQALGYQFVITPVLVNVMVILAVAFLYNYLFSWRRYPAWLQQSKEVREEIPAITEPGGISHSDFVYALSQLDSFIDISEYDLLRMLLTNSGKVLTHRQLLQGVWGPEYGEETEYLRTFVKQLRRKLEVDPSRPSHIITEPGVGYRFSE